MLQRSELIRVLAITALASGALPTACQSQEVSAPPQAPPVFSPAAPAEAEEEGDEAPVTYRIEAEVEEGEAASRVLVAQVTPLNGYHVNLLYPWNLTVHDDAPTCAGVSQGRDEAVSFEEEGATFRIPVADGAAVGEILADLRFGVCNDEGCLNPREELAWELAQR